MVAPSRLPRTRQGAATLRLAASSVVPVEHRYEHSLRPCATGVSRLPSTIQTGGDHLGS
jgi:hypothetical protein